MQFTELTLAPEILGGLGLPDIPYDVPTVYFEHVGFNPKDLSFGVVAAKT